jgi:hypothetical protein
MFKLIVFLCAGLYAVMFVMGRDGGPVRDGLAGKITPLMQPEEARTDTRQQAAAAPEPAVAVVEPAASIAPAPVAEASTTPAVVTQASFPDTADEAQQSGLTLALPLVDAATAAPAPQAETEPAAGPATDPIVMYVTGSSVNVRSGPSAETEALTRLPRGEAVLVLPSDTPGWSMIRLEGDGVEGYIASRFLGGRVEEGLFQSVD